MTGKAWALVTARQEHQDEGFGRRFDPEWWTVDFARPAMAAVVSDGFDALRVTASFHDRDALVGLIWESRDRWSHPLLAMAEARDYRRCRLSFRWRSGGVKPLDAVHGPTLTIEGRDADGRPAHWYVRLWNYAAGTPEDARITLDFADLEAGYSLPGEGRPVFAGDIDRLMISLVPPDYDGTAAPLAGPAEGWVELSGIACAGSGAAVPIGDAWHPPHGLGIATGYDDCYNQTPARVVRQIARLGWRGEVVHYVGMSHFPALARHDGDDGGDGGDGALDGGAPLPGAPLAGGAPLPGAPLAGGAPLPGAPLAGGAGDPLCAPARAWHEGFAAAAKAAGLGIIWSISFELFAAMCPDDWQQRFADGSPARTGWSPPSALIAPGHGEAVAWLGRAAAAFVGIGVDAGLAPRLQIGEPWWWSDAAGRIALHDAASAAAIRAELGGAEVVAVDLDAPLTEPARATLSAAGRVLAGATAKVVAAARAAVPDVRTHLLVFTPTVLDPARPGAMLANVPEGWAAPAFDVLQVEDYDWLTAGRGAESGPAAAAMAARLGYPVAAQDYLAGFVLAAADRDQWARIMEGAAAARARGHARVIVWALPQVARDGLVVAPPPPPPTAQQGEDAMQAFDAVEFPLAIGSQAEVVTEFSTQVIESPAGHEQRLVEWADARMRFDAGPGVRSAADVAALTAFFRARRGAARGFRFRDPTDWTSAPDGTSAPGPADQPLGTGDGVRRDFALVKHYGEDGDGGGDGDGDGDGWAQVRPITQPDPASVVVSIDGTVVDGVTLAPPARVGEGARLLLPHAPAAGASVRCGFTFAVPVRFATDRLAVGPALFAAGEVPSVPLVEVRA